MNKSEIDHFAQDWIERTEVLIQKFQANATRPDKSLSPDALDEMVREEPEDAWLVIDAVRKKTSDELMLANLAAGPLENLIEKHGANFIDRLEDLARADESFAFLLTGVWLSGSPSADVVSRVNAIVQRQTSKRSL